VNNSQHIFISTNLEKNGLIEIWELSCFVN
jgi:hypothetical protein